jgi:hypothetical protein
VDSAIRAGEGEVDLNAIETGRNGVRKQGGSDVGRTLIVCWPGNEVLEAGDSVVELQDSADSDVIQSPKRRLEGNSSCVSSWNRWSNRESSSGEVDDNLAIVTNTNDSSGRSRSRDEAVQLWLPLEGNCDWATVNKIGVAAKDGGGVSSTAI